MFKAVSAIGCYLMLISVLCLVAAAQDPAPPPPPPPSEKAPAEDETPGDPCPKIVINAPTKPIRDGHGVRLTANLAGGDKKVAPIFDWSISAGVIRSGQGTPTIDVDSTGAGADRAIYATLLIGGYSSECYPSANAIIPVAGPPTKVDEFGTLPDEEMAARIESGIASVRPDDHVYIFAYAGRTNVRGYASATLRQIRAMALKEGLTADRLVTMDGGYREEAAFELWTVPVGAEPPRPSPTVNPREIVFPRTPPRRP